ncbi:MAG: hypothetical protein AB1Z22_02940 [Synechococcaceae cyanobacterium]
MHRPSTPTAPRSPQQGRDPRPGRQLSAALLSWTALLGLAAAPAVRAAEPPYPSRDQLRELQLITFNCARDNQSDDCDRARLQADPLIDHPRLPGICKDTLWTILQEAVVVPRNSFERRDRLDRAGEDLMRFCPRNPPTPARSGGGASGSPSGPPGGGFRGGPGR